MDKAQIPGLGIIEGFYGRFYTGAERKRLISFAASHGMDTYIFAPKNFDHLRKAWREGFSRDEVTALRHWSAHAHRLGMIFGVGISPINLTLTYNDDRDLFLSRVNSLVSGAGLDAIAILFDDVKLDCARAAQVQNAIIKDACGLLCGKVKRLYFCPTYYSFDPILDRIFGARPETYLRDLMQGLPDFALPFWTGDKVVPERVSPDSVARATEALGRRPVLWDNYPVNDSKRLSPLLRLSPFKGREGLSGLVEGHLSNPMLEPRLSEIPLLTLEMVYQGKGGDDIKAAQSSHLRKILPGMDGHTLELLKRCETEGRQAVRIHEASALEKKIRGRDTLGWRELQHYLKGYYRFDPSCLT